jgi:NADP-dependent 3-hydroxy acid dehydrogenase YdfG
MSEMKRWEGRTALVTGASSGIGRAVAIALARAGMKVAICARREHRIRQLEEEMPAGPDGVLARRVDLRDEQQILELFRAIEQRWGGVDVLVNNAGLGHLSPLTSGKTEHWREMLEVNVLALCICTREALRQMEARGQGGYVIHISSMAAHRVPPGSGVYSATKFAVRSLTEGLRQELRARGSSVRVTAISPGFVETEFAAHFHKSEAKARETYGRFEVLQPEEIADAVTYVLSQPPHVQVHDILIRPTDQQS